MPMRDSTSPPMLIPHAGERIPVIVPTVVDPMAPPANPLQIER
jgi:hypothetical protein